MVVLELLLIEEQNFLEIEGLLQGQTGLITYVAPTDVHRQNRIIRLLSPVVCKEMSLTS